MTKHILKDFNAQTRSLGNIHEAVLRSGSPRINGVTADV